MLTKGRVWVTVLAVVVCLSSLFVISIARYRPTVRQLQQVLSEKLGRPVTLAGARLVWRHGSPEIILHGVSIGDHARRFSLEIKRISVRMSWWQSLLHWGWYPSRIEAEEVTLDVGARQLSSASGSPPAVDFAKQYRELSAVLHHQLPTTTLIVHALHCRFFHWHHPVVDIIIPRLMADSTQRGYQLTLLAALQHTSLTARAVIRFSELNAKGPDAAFTFSAKHVATRNLDAWPGVASWLQRQGVVSARGDIKLKGRWHANSLTHMDLGFKWRKVKLATRPLPKWLVASELPSVVNVTQLVGHLQWLKHADSLQLTFPVLSIQLGRQQLSTKALVMHFSLHHQVWYLNQLQTSHWQLSDLLFWSHYFHLRKGYFVWLQRLHPLGELMKMSFTWGPLLNLHSLRIAFKHLAWRSWQRIPGLDHVAGALVLSDKHLAFDLNARNGEVTSSLLKRAHYFHSLSLQGDALYFGKNANIHLTQARVTDGNLDASVHGYVRLRHHHSPFIDLIGKVALRDAARVNSDLPEKLLSPPLRHWLEHSIVGGALQQGRILWHGRLDQFPYAHGHGRFVIAANLDNFQVRFSPLWPTLEEMQGNLSFINNGMYLHLVHAKLSANSITALRAKIVDFNHPWLDVDSEVASDLANGLAVLHRSPLAVGRRLRQVAASGPYRLSLGLRINLDRADPVQARGKISFDHDIVSILQSRFKLSQVLGVLNFTGHALWGSRLRAQWLGAPMAIKVRTHGSYADRVVDLGLQGRVSWRRVFGSLGVSVNHLVSGSIAAVVHVLLPFNSQQATTLSLHSTLRGTQIDGVQPWIKSTTERWPLQLRYVTDASDHHQFRAGIPGIFSARLHWGLSGHGLAGLVGVGVSIGGVVPVQGLQVIGHLARVDVMQWWALWKRLQAVIPRHRTRPRDLPSATVDLTIGHLQLLKTQFKRLHLQAQLDQQRIKVKVNAKSIAAGVKIPLLTAAPWVVTAQHCQWGALPEGDKGTFDPLLLPALQVNVNNLDIAKSHFKHIGFVSSVVGHTVKLNKIDIQSALYTLHAHGSWLWRSAKQQRSTLLGTASVHNVGQLLNRYGVHGVVAGGSAGVGFDVDWPTGLLHPELKHLTGQARLWVDQGSFILNRQLHHSLVLIRLLNVLGIDSLLRNLSSGFSDLLANRLKFDRISGSMVLRDGELVLQHVKLAAPSLQLLLSGKVIPSAQQLDLSLMITPQLTSSMPLIAGLAGGPLVGAVTWVVNKWLSPYIGRAAAHYYTVTGSWKHLVVASVAKSTVAKVNLSK